MSEFAPLATERLSLRALRPSDAPMLHRLVNDWEVARNLEHVPFPYSLAQAEQWIGQTVALLAAGTGVHLAVTGLGAEADTLIGVVGLTIDGPRRQGHLGYWIGRPHWGRGYATEATRAALQWAGGDWGRRMVVAGHFADNAASARVLVKAGFLYTGDIQRRHSRARGAIVPTRMMVWLA